MSLVTLHGLGQSFGAFDLFAGVSAMVAPDAKIGLVGPNGIGKTTLLQLIAGLAEPTRGSVARGRGARLGYLRQEAVEAFAGKHNTVYEEMLTVFADVRAQEARLRDLEAAMADGATDGLWEQYGAAQEAFERAGGYEYELRIRQVLDGLGFKPPHWTMPLSHLSGGQKTRVLLGRLLLERPDLLILDEPTNHLDIEAVEWLEGTLRVWEGALLVVSHDRYFLDKVVNTIWEMGREGVESYRGNYSAYVRQRQERWERHQKLWEQEKERLDKELDFIRRNIAGQATDQARGRLKRLSRFLWAVDQMGLMAVQGKSWSEMAVDHKRELTVSEAAQRIASLRPPSTRPPQLNLHLKAAHRSGDLVLRTKDLQVGYPGHPLFEADDIALERLETVALIGGNGVGKTTLLRVALGQLAPLRGEVRLGASLKIGYFSQAHEGLNAENSVMQELRRHRDMADGEARSFLAQYGFREDDVWKPVGALSGGERGRLALALLSLTGANLLLLDEPTNHLDIPSQETLQEVLEAFEGTILLVSHDRYLVDRLATQIWEVRGERLRVFRGDYQEFLAARERERATAKAATEAQRAAPPNGAAKTGDRAARKRAEQLAALETQIAEAEAQLDQHSAALQRASEAQAFDRIQRASDAFAATQSRLDTLLAEWETLAEAVEG